MPHRYTVDPRIEGTSLPVCDLPLCQLRLSTDANYPWLILLPRRAGVQEIIDLSPVDRQALMDEITLTSKALKALTACDKLNVAALGNMVPQLHIHVVARFRTDGAWPGPIWGAHPAKTYQKGEAEELISRLCSSIR